MYLSYEKRIIQVSPPLEGRVTVSYPMVVKGIGEYINDVVHYKIWDGIEERINKAKIIAHTAKWLCVYPPVALRVPSDEWSQMGKKTRKFSVRVPIRFAMYAVNYLLCEPLSRQQVSNPLEHDIGDSNIILHPTAIKPMLHQMEKGNYDPEIFSFYLERIIGNG